jgi:selenocysteine-specific elongation factor
LQQLESVFQSAGYAVPDVTAALAQVKLPEAQAKALLHLLYRQGKLVRVGTELVFHRDALQQLRGTLAAKKGTRFTVPQFKEWTGISRKYAIPLLEHLDRERVTRREGEVRIIL